jgi:hypothetical protein
VEPEETAVGRKLPLNTFSLQLIHECNDRGTVGGCVLYEIGAQAIKGDPVA